MGSIGNVSNIAEQKFKLVSSSFGNTSYESELFKITKYSKNTPGTSWSTSGYMLSIKNQYTKNAPKFNTLKDAKQYANSEEGHKWYYANKKEK